MSRKSRKRDRLLSKLWKKYGETLHYKTEAAVKKRSAPPQKGTHNEE